MQAMEISEFREISHNIILNKNKGLGDPVLLIYNSSIKNVKEK